MNKEGTAIILSSHNLSEIDRVTSHILFLKNGQLIEEDLSLHEKVAYELTVQQPEKVIGVLSAAGIEVEHGKENKLIVSLGDASLSQLFKQLSTHGVQVLNIEKKVIGSEERYQMIFGKKEEIL
ncbi:ABC transporter ATP-binding protein [Mesobacillus boroniphilus JCM 21738]|uniref:ABC transporter ATP-binding protein n=1 Tax=Mesobacillus boroniphilus JCM 21738 TaxID=1294265 RepID=W4RVE0_9BACI|nr:ABC transporter ATP-binding protein [Mesobacillus boroniphilus JCM 21738]